MASIRKTGKYSYDDDMNHTYSDRLTFKIKNETDLHTKVVSFIKRRFPNNIFTATLGENQDTGNKRIESDNKGYLLGSLDLIINNLHKHYTEFQKSKWKWCFITQSVKDVATVSKQQL